MAAAQAGVAAGSVFVVHKVKSGTNHDKGVILCMSCCIKPHVLLVVISIFNNLLDMYGLTSQGNQINLTDLPSKCCKEVSGWAELSTGTQK